MEKKKVSKKALRALLNDSMREAVGKLELPKPSKKIKKLISHAAKELASEFARVLKKDRKKEKRNRSLLISANKKPSSKRKTIPIV